MSQRILVTRPELQHHALVQAIENQGNIPLTLPLLNIIEFSEAIHSDECARVKAVVQCLGEYQHIIFISTNAARLGAYWVNRFWPQLPIKQVYYAIGEATQKALGEAGINAQHTLAASVSMNSESLLEHPALQQLLDQKILIFRGCGGRHYLQHELQRRGANVEYCEVYRREKIHYSKGELKQYWQSGIDILTITSAETIHQLLDQAMMDNIKNQLLRIPLIVPGERLFALATSLGFEHPIKSDNAGVKAMINAINAL